MQSSLENQTGHATIADAGGAVLKLGASVPRLIP